MSLTYYVTQDAKPKSVTAVNHSSNMTTAIENLEIKLAYLEQSYEALNEVVTQLQTENFELKQQLDALRNYIKSQADSGLMNASDEPPPPHY